MSVAVTDQQPNGLSAIYTFFEPDEERRSLGVLSILQQIEVCRLGLPYLYLGYWVQDCAKMAYKTFSPRRAIPKNQWTRLD